MFCDVVYGIYCLIRMNAKRVLCFVTFSLLNVQQITHLYPALELHSQFRCVSHVKMTEKRHVGDDVPIIKSFIYSQSCQMEILNILSLAQSLSYVNLSSTNEHKLYAVYKKIACHNISLR